MKKIFRMITAGAALLLIAGTCVFYIKKKPVYIKEDEVHLCKVQRTDLDKSIYITASVVSDDVEQVYSYVDAPVSEVKVNTGDTVKKGDVICTFDCTGIQKEYDSYMLMLEQLRNLDGIMASGFNDKAAREKLLAGSQTDQLNKAIENYQKKYNETLAMEEEYSSMYEDAVHEQEELRLKIESIENNRSQLVPETDSSDNSAVGDNSEIIINENSTDSVSEDITEESVLNENTENSGAEEIRTSGESDAAYENVKKLYQIVTEKKDRLYEKKQEMKGEADEISEMISKYRKDLDLLMLMKNSGSEEKYFTPERYENMIASYSEKTEKLKEILDGRIVTAAKDGVITDMYVSSNEYVSENLICRIQDPEKLHFSAYITPENLSQVSETSRVAVDFFESEYIEHAGRILEIKDSYDVQNKGYEICFTIDDIEKYELYPGHEVSARIILESQPDTLAVPYDAVFETDGQTYVRKYDESGVYEDIPVKKRLETSYYVAVESDALSENDLVATEMLN